jgi:hypothetical protein
MRGRDGDLVCKRAWRSIDAVHRARPTTQARVCRRWLLCALWSACHRPQSGLLYVSSFRFCPIDDTV